MRTYSKILIFAILLAAILAYCFYNNINQDIKTVFNNSGTNKVFVFQVGVFTKKDNALKLKNKYPSGDIYQENNLYHVIISVTLNNKELLENYYKARNVNYIIKEELIDDNKTSKILDYDKIIKSTHNKEVIEKISKASVALFLEN